MSTPDLNKMAREWRKKPVVIEAFQMTKERRMDNSEWPDWLNIAWQKGRDEPGALSRQDMTAELPDHLIIHTLDGYHLVGWGDFIIRGAKGELYPCKPDIFEAAYEPAAYTAGAASVRSPTERLREAGKAMRVELYDAARGLGGVVLNLPDAQFEKTSKKIEHILGLLAAWDAALASLDQQKGDEGECSKTSTGLCAGAVGEDTDPSSTAAPIPSAWIPVELRLPEPGMPVIAFVVDLTRPTWSCRIRAHYAAENTTKLGDEHDPWEGCTQREEGGDWFVQPGWYETNEYEETNWRVSNTVTHWQPLPLPPSTDNNLT